MIKLEEMRQASIASDKLLRAAATAGRQPRLASAVLQGVATDFEREIIYAAIIT